MPLRYLSLFSGIGCFEVGIHNVFGENAECVGFSEIDKQAIKVYQTHFPDHKLRGPVQDVNGRDFEGIDLLVGGSPCQDLASSNVKTRWGKALPPGLKGKKSGLFFEFVRLLKEANPRYFILENVSSMKNVDKDKITETLGVEPIEINARLFTPQNRKRLFWTNIPLTAEDRDLLKNARPRHTIKDILIPVNEAKKYIVNPSESKIYQSYLKKKEKYGSVIRMAVVESDDETCPALLAGRVIWVHDKRINEMRKMAPIELERLQSLPAGWCDGVSYTNCSKLIGNGVNCKAVQFLIECLKRNK
jgi:DNA-cytosine methyltransferase